MIMAFLTKYLRIIEWAVLAIAISGSLYAGWHARYIFDQAQDTKVAKAEVKDVVKTAEKKHEVDRKVDSLPDGAAAGELLKRWSRD